MTLNLRILLLTTLALLAFAANSVLCRNALLGGHIDPGLFSIIRLSSGALTLYALVFILKRPLKNSGSWAAGIALCLYAVSFSYAYITLDTGSGALILFACVQFTIIGTSVWRGERFTAAEWIGTGLAFAGFVYLIAPQVHTPSAAGLLLMAIAGAAWGGYTIMGRTSKDALADTAFNFLRSLPFLGVILVLYLSNSQLGNNLNLQPHSSNYGIILAVLSGTLASGAGYALWYSVLPKLSTVTSALAQLLVPLLAAAGGLLFSAETVKTELFIAAAMILSGIALATILKGKSRR